MAPVIALTIAGRALGILSCAVLMISLARPSLSPGFVWKTITAAFPGHSGRGTFFQAEKSVDLCFPSPAKAEEHHKITRNNPDRASRCKSVFMVRLQLEHSRP